MSIFRVLDKLENFVYNARPRMPLFWQDYAIFNREKLLNLIERTRTSLPQEMQRARWISKEHQKFLQDGKDKAALIIKESENRGREIIELAKEERLKILNESDIMLEARQMASNIIKEAETNARMIIEKTRAEGRKMVDEAERVLHDARAKSTDLVRSAEEQSTSLLSSAQEEATGVKRSAYEYANKVVSSLDGEVGRIVGSITNVKDKLTRIGQG